MEKSAVILKSENGAVTYVIGEVVTKTQEQLEQEIDELTLEVNSICSQDVDALRVDYNEKIEALKQEAELAIQSAIKENELANERVAKLNESIDNLRVVLSQFRAESVEKTFETQAEERSLDLDEMHQPTVGQAL